MTVEKNSRSLELYLQLREEMRTEIKAELYGDLQGLLAPTKKLGRSSESFEQARAALQGEEPPRSTRATPPSFSTNGGRRSAEDIARLQAAILEFIRDNPGCRAPHITKHFGLQQKDINRPLDQLKKSRLVKAAGYKAAMTYTAKE